MRKILVNLSRVIALLLISTTTYSVETAINTAYDPSGVWNLEVDLPDSTQEATMNISKNEDGEYEVVISDGTSDESKELEEISFDEEEKSMTGEFETEGYTVTLEINFDGDSVEGTISAGGMDLSFTGERETK